MKVGELCVRDVVTAWASETVIDAAQRMAGLHVGDVIVVEGGEPAGALPRPIGIITDRDLVVQVLAHPERDPATTKIADVMQHDLITAKEDDEIETVAERMRVHGIRRIPVIDAGGGLQGVLSIDDIVGWIRDQLQTLTRLLERQGQGPTLRPHVH